MQDHPLGHSGPVVSAPVEHLDLVTAELRRRIAGIGLAIAELREETGRLRASADGRHHAVAVLERPLDDASASSDVCSVVASQPTVIEPKRSSPEAPRADRAGRFESRIPQPVSPWGDAAVAIVAPMPADRPGPTPAATVADVADVAVAERVGGVEAAAASRAVEPTLTWIPETVPAAVAAPVVVGRAVAASALGERSQETFAVLRPDSQASSLWADGDDEDMAAFEAFFSAEIEPEPSQRWLLSD